MFTISIFGEVAQAVVLPLGASDFCLHTCRDSAAEHPHPRALAHDGIAKEYPKLSLVRVGIVRPARKSNRNSAPVVRSGPSSTFVLPTLEASFSIFFVKRCSIAICPEQEALCPRRGPAHLLTNGIQRHAWGPSWRPFGISTPSPTMA